MLKINPPRPKSPIVQSKPSEMLLNLIKDIEKDTGRKVEAANYSCQAYSVSVQFADPVPKDKAKKE